MSGLQVLHKGGRSEQARVLKRAMNRRLHARALDSYRVAETDVVTNSVLLGARKVAWIMGALPVTFQAITSQGQIPIGVQQMILNPGLRNPQQLGRARDRLSHLRALQKRRHEEAAGKPQVGHRTRIASLAQLAASHYRDDPRAYHYLAGGVANLIYLAPSPLSYRSDCSQFAASVYYGAGLPSPANVPHEYASTFSMVLRGRLTMSPRMGDLGMYGSRIAPHHVEIFLGLPGAMFIGHGSPPIDSLTPGTPDYYLTYPFLDAVGTTLESEFQARDDVVPVPDLTGELSRATEAAMEGVVQRDQIPEIEAAGELPGFSGLAEDHDDDARHATTEQSAARVNINSL